MRNHKLVVLKLLQHNAPKCRMLLRLPKQVEKSRTHARAHARMYARALAHPQLGRGVGASKVGAVQPARLATAKTKASSMMWHRTKKRKNMKQRKTDMDNN